MSFQFLKRTWFSCVNPETVNFDNYLGRHFWVTDSNGREVRVEAQRIVGSKAKGRANYLEIWNGTEQYQCPVIDFYAQLEGTRANKEELEHFEEIAKSGDVKVNRNWQPSWKKQKGLWTPPSRKN